MFPWSRKMRVAQSSRDIGVYILPLDCSDVAAAVVVGGMYTVYRQSTDTLVSSRRRASEDTSRSNSNYDHTIDPCLIAIWRHTVCRKWKKCENSAG